MIEVRRLTSDDWQVLRQVRLSALAESPLAFWTSVEAESRVSEEEWRARAGAASFVAYDGASPIAMAAGVVDQDGRHLLVGLWVAPSHRGRGVARPLVDAVVEWARADGATSLSLGVAEDNVDAEAMYVRWGFVRRESGPQEWARGPLVVHFLTLAL